MRAFRFLHLAILSVLVATSAAVYAQDEKPQEDKPKQEEPKKQEEARPAEKRDEAKPAGKQDEMKAPRQDEAKPARQDKNDQKEMEKQSRDQQPGQRPEAAPQEHGRPAGKGGHIPDDKFRTQFGHGHTFHAQRPQVVNGQPQFNYGGYNFVLVDSWPAEWAYTDDCYIDYVDGEYFLFDLLHPGMRIALFVVE